MKFLANFKWFSKEGAWFKRGIDSYRRKKPKSSVLIWISEIWKLWDFGRRQTKIWFFQLSFFSFMTRFQTEMVGSGPVPFSCRVSSPGPLLRLFFLSLVPVASWSFCQWPIRIDSWTAADQLGLNYGHLTKFSSFRGNLSFEPSTTRVFCVLF